MSPESATPIPGAAPGAASEIILWEGAPSSWQNFWWWVSIIGIPVAIWKHILLKTTHITLTNQRLKIRSGLLNKKMEEIELYRVKDWTHSEPLMQRMLGFGSVTVVSSDRTAPEVTYQWLKDAKGFSEKLRNAVEAVRDRKRVRAIEMDEGEDHNGGAFS
jgi:hypothetical protein